LDTVGTPLVVEDAKMASNNLVLKHGSRRDINALAFISHDNHSSLESNARSNKDITRNSELV